MKSRFGPGNCFFNVAISVIVLMPFCCPILWARPTATNQAQKVVRGWLKTSTRPLGAVLGQQVGTTDTFTDENGTPLYYVVYLKPSGFVIVPADDEVEPIIALVERGTYDPSAANPLGALVSRDVPGRIAAVRSGLHLGTRGKNRTDYRAALRKAKVKAQGKWYKWSGYAEAPDKTPDKSESSVSDVRVAPLVQSTWSQDTIGSYIGGTICYSYYTPYNWPCGCIATAMAQLIRYHEHQPTWGVGSLYMGGDGSGGPYVWSNMPLQPDDDTITLTQIQAIGALCYDAAESVETSYGPGGSSASLHDAAPALINPFGYTNSIHGYNNLNNIGSGLTEMINPNLDAAHPVLLGLNGPGGGHAVVCDGYGYISSTLYHHLNMGWSGTNDAWYNLPIVDAYYYYDTINTCIYNIFTSGAGEIISGWVTGPGGLPINGVSITATGGGTYQAITNEQGIYALLNVPSNKSFTVTASKSPWNFSNKSASTGRSQDDNSTSGNDWGVNFTGTISAGFVEFDKDVYLPSESIGITLVDSDIAGSGSYDVVVTTSSGLIGDEETVSLIESPAGSGLFVGSIPSNQAWISPGDGIIQIDYGDTLTVTYEDADDGTGNPATAQDAATVPAMILDADFTGGLPVGWTIIDGGSGSHTWVPDHSNNWVGRPHWDGTLNGYFMVVDSDSAGFETMDEQLITPALDCSNMESVTLTFLHQFVFYSGYEVAAVDIRVNGGSWQNLLFYQGQVTSGEVDVDIASFADNQANVQIRWHYYDAQWDYYWGIDDVQVKGVMLPSEAPVAQDDSVSTYSGTTEIIELQATDDGLPGPLTYIITSLPGHGTLEDANSGLIINTTPYNLSNNDRWVIYASDADYTGPDEFTFKANDGQSNSNIATITIDVISSEISAEVNLDNLWMYQNLPGLAGSNLTANVLITDDPLSNGGYTYEWEIILPDDVRVAPVTVDGGENDDDFWTFAAPGCDEPNGLSDSGKTFTVRVTVTGTVYGNTTQAETQFGIALLGDVNNDKSVNLADRSIINAFWRLGAAGPYTFTDCNINCDIAVNLADRSIANAVWRGVLGRNSVNCPCPLR